MTNQTKQPVQLYEVPVVYKGYCTYLVQARSASEAAEIATSMFNGGDMPDPLGNECETIDRLGDITVVETRPAT